MSLEFASNINWLSVQGSDCVLCTGKTYDVSAGITINATYSNKTYDDGVSFNGIEIEDQVCLDEACVSTQEFIAYDALDIN